MSIEDRLNADAAGGDEGRAPDFETMLDRATRSRQRGWVAVAASAAVVAAIAVGISVFGSRSTPGPTAPGVSTSAGPTFSVPLPTPRSIIYQGHRYSATEIHPYAALPDPGHPDAVLIFAVRQLDSEPECNALRPSVRPVAQSGSRIVIASFDYEVERPTSGSLACTVSIGLFNRPDYVIQRVRLDAPLGTRVISDAADGSAVPVIDEYYVPTATYLPAGFHQTRAEPGRPANHLASERAYGRGADLLDVEARPADQALDDGRPVSVDGHDAVLVDRDSFTPDQSCIRWYQRPGVLYSVCTGTGQLSERELIHVAQGVR